MSLKPTPLPFSSDQQGFYESACTQIDAARLQQLTFDLTDIHSPTGAEEAASRYLAGYMNGVGLPAQYQAVSASSGNCIGRIAGDGSGPTVMLYAPIDTHLDADPDIDLPWAGPTLRADMVPHAQIQDDTVLGLGASNPKSMVATLTEAARCVQAAGVPLKGDILVASCGGGMPWIATERAHTGISSGVMHMLSHGITADFGVIFKPWDEVYYEHPGMVWFKVTTWGSMGYSGIPRGIPEFRSSIVPGARVILDLEKWLSEYPEGHMSGQIKPEGWVAAVRAGWPDKPAFPSAACEIYLDLRTNPDQSMAEIEAEFGNVMREIVARHDDVEATWETFVTCRGSRTEPDNWIIQSALRGWESVHERSYPGAEMLSGQTDAATICQMGIPLVRIGYPWVGDKDMPKEFSDGLGGMGVAVIPDLIDPMRHLIYILIDSCTRTREEVGLKHG